MRHAHTVEQVRAAEGASMAGLPPGVLMQRAATGLAYAVIDLLGGCYGRRVVLLVGAGDNGGDALHAGALLARRGAAVEAWLLLGRAHEGGLAALRAAGGSVARPRPLRAGSVDVVVDGVLGIGGRSGLPPEVAEAVIPIHRSIRLVAVDVPSGVDVDTGERPGMALHADLTVALGTHKVAHLVDPAAGECGAVRLVDLGLDLPDAPVGALEAADVAALVGPPAPDAQKYALGVVGLRTGSARYPGAGLLSVAGANTGLAGMVRYVGSAADVVGRCHPEVVGEGRVQAWVVGSGTDDEAGPHLEAALADDVPLVVDADALTLAARHLAARELDTRRPRVRLGAHSAPMVLTPHAGELATLLDKARADVERRPLASVREAAERFGCVVLLKGRRTLIARRPIVTSEAPGAQVPPHPSHRPRAPQSVRVNTTGTPWLATAGAGDVLAGLIGALLARGLDPFDAASAGAWIHGAAATLASRGGPLTALRVAEAIPAVVTDLRS